MSDLTGILDSLAREPRDDVNRFRLGLNALWALGKWGGSQEDTSAAHRVYDIIRREMQAAGLVSTSEAVPYKRLPNRSDFSAKATQLIEFVTTQHDQQMVQDGILRIGVRLLIEHLRRFVGDDSLDGDPLVSVAMVCRNIHKVPARLDRSFPGYGAAGLLRLLVRNGR